jgi:hypothetical protein
MEDESEEAHLWVSNFSHLSIFMSNFLSTAFHKSTPQTLDVKKTCERMICGF